MKHRSRFPVSLILCTTAAAAVSAGDGGVIQPLGGNVFPPVSINGHLDEWQDLPVSLGLSGAEGVRRQAQVWLGTWSHGLSVAGRVRAEAARFEGTAETVHVGDHVLIRLALIEDLALPPIGFGNQHGEVHFGSDADCPEVPNRSFPVAGPALQHHCRSWVAGQQPHRERLRRLFMRRWVLGPALGDSDPGVALEDIASPAFAGLDSSAQEQLAVLRPAGRPRMAVRAEPDDPDHYAFEVQIPWEAMPPAAALAIEKIHLAIEIHAGHENGEDDDVALPGARPDAWTAFRLATPRQHELGACRAPLRGLDPYRRWQPAYFSTPSGNHGARVESVFVVANEAGGYRDSPFGRSPSVHVTRFFDTPVGEDAAVCGPGLALHRGTERVPIRLPGPPPDDDSMGSWIPEEMQARREGDQIVVTLGPRVASTSWFGTGQCGACPRANLRILSIDAEDHVETLLDVDRVIDLGTLVDVDLHLSDDWRRLERYELRPAESDGALRWHRDSFCRTDGAFEPCGSADDVAPPSRVLPPLEG